MSLEDQKVKAIYRTFLAARQKCKEPTGTLSFEKVARTLRKQYAAQQGDIDFKVVIRNGKAAIKTVKRD